MDLKSDRLILRDFKPTDHDSLYEYLSNPEVCKYDNWVPQTSDQVKTIIHATKGEPWHFELAIALKDTDKLIGNIAIRRESLNSSIASLSYALNPVYTGQGYATEAVKALLTFGFTEMSLEVIYAICEEANMPSSAVLERANLKYVGYLKDYKHYKGANKSFFRYEITRQDHKDQLK